MKSEDKFWFFWLEGGTFLYFGMFLLCVVFGWFWVSLLSAFFYVVYHSVYMMYVVKFRVLPFTFRWFPKKIRQWVLEGDR